MIDLAVTSVTRDDLFALLVNGRVLIRWIRQELTGGYVVQDEDRERYPDQQLSLMELSNLTIIGRAVIVGNIR